MILFAFLIVISVCVCLSALFSRQYSEQDKKNPKEHSAFGMELINSFCFSCNLCLFC